ncbi:MAG: DUF5681 domain-containing protein [Pseudomonadota bacterium]|nr:DUF5681 domain-containing protein [Pseudomonadota bacterium]
MSDEGYKVGYGKPPKRTRFKKGQSGNPKGRKKSKTDLESLTKEMMRTKVFVTIDGKRKKVTVAEAMTLQLRTDILTGTPIVRSRAMKQLKEICPDVYLPLKEMIPTTINVHFVEADDCGGIYSPTDHETRVLKAIWRMHKANMLDLDNLLKSVGGDLDVAPQFLNPTKENDLSFLDQ